MEELIPIFLFLTVGAVLILRPITKKLGLLLEAIAKSKMGTPGDATAELTRIRGALEQMSKRLDLMDERQDFTERLVSSAQRRTARYEQAGRPEPLGAGGNGLFEHDRQAEYLSR
jgi:hypothetical protein